MRSSIGRQLVLAIALALVMGASGTALATNTVKIDSKVKIRDRAPAFHGKVTADNNACAEQRRVKLFKKRRSGQRKLLGSTQSDDQGKWAVLVDPLKSGAYFAVARKRREGTAGTIFVCKRAKSRTVAVD